MSFSCALFLFLLLSLLPTSLGYDHTLREYHMLHQLVKLHQTKSLHFDSPYLLANITIPEHFTFETIEQSIRGGENEEVGDATDATTESMATQHRLRIGRKPPPANKVPEDDPVLTSMQTFAQYASIAYCSKSQIAHWKCKAKCRDPRVDGTQV
jgi:hypothetical protein